MTSKVIQGHIRTSLSKNSFSAFVYGMILITICMNANIIETQFFHKIIPEMSFYVMKNFCDFLLKDLLT